MNDPAFRPPAPKASARRWLGLLPPRKPLIVVVYDFEYWIIGRWARHIRRIYGDAYDIRLVGMYDIDKRASPRRLVASADLVHAMLPHCFERIRQLRPTKPIIAVIHHWVDWPFVSGVARDADALMVGSMQWCDNLIQHMVPADKITVVNCGIEAAFLQPHEPLLQPSRRTTVGFCAKNTSNEEDRKGTRHFKAVLARIAAMGRQDDVRVVITGPGWDDLVAEFKARGFDVQYFEFLDDAKMPGLYRSLDLYLMLSDVDGGPATVIEAMASHCVIIASNIGLVRQHVRDGFNGIVVDNTDHQRIADAILAFDPSAEVVEAIRRNAYQTASSMRFDDTLRPLRDLYARVLARQFAGATNGSRRRQPNSSPDKGSR